jgi:aerobic carbon-monoxide dehydrogenase large subunit
MHTDSPSADAKSFRRYIGQPMPRFEDIRLVRGAGRYTDDLSLDDQSHAVVVRSAYAHANIVRIETATASSMPGVLGIFTGKDYVADGHVGLAHFPNPADAIDVRRPSFQPMPGRRLLDEPQLPLAAGRVRFLGEAVAIVVASTLTRAREAAEAVSVEYEPLPAVADAMAALASDAPVLWPAAPSNVALDQEFGDLEKVEAAMAQAHLVIAHTIRSQRTASAFMEPRSGIGCYDAREDRYTLISGCQGVHRIRHPLALCLDVPAEQVRVICPDVGGAFGSRTNLYPEQVALAWAAHRVGRPVKWTADRTEAFLTDYTARDVATKARLAFDRRGHMLALALELTANIGAYTVSYVPLSNGFRVAPTVYDVPLAYVRVRGVMTNTVPTAPFRGAGRPEATAVMERLIDMAAKRLGMDRVKLRRRNLISPEQLPYRTATGLTYDSGDFHGNLARALELADWNGFAARRRAARKRGRLRGIGMANYVETPVGMPHERVALRISKEGRVELIVGTQSSGQGHETSFRQVIADALGIEPECVDFVSGDSAALASGGGTHSDRSMRLAGTLMVQSAKTLIEKARRVAAILLQTSENEIEFADGLFAARRSNQRLTLFDVARAMDDRPGLPEDLHGPLTAEATFTGRIPAYPTGAAICEVEVDPETGITEICRYSSVDDGGQAINPLILHGQVHGGVAQGVGQAMLEQGVYEPASAQLLSASFLDYSMPRADHFPSLNIELTEHPTRGNALRVKGGGEAGITPSPAAFINAVVDALADFGIEHLDMPATPYRVWSAINSAAPRKSGSQRRI